QRYRGFPQTSGAERIPAGPADGCVHRVREADRRRRARRGYTFANMNWSPRVGIQLDAASGDGNTRQTFGTFNPLFPNGYYFTLAGYTGYANLIHIKPSLTLAPTSSLKIAFAAAALWRQTTADAVYIQPDVAVPKTAGRPGAYTGSYGQFRLDWTI